MKHHSLFAFVLVASVISACGGGGYGGGGGGYTPPPNLMSAPGETALAAYLQASHQNTLKASSMGSNFTLQISSVPNAGTTTFNMSAPAYSLVQTVTLTVNGTAQPSGVSTAYFFLNPYVPLGVVSSTGNPYGVVTSSTPFPGTLNVGASGPVDSLTDYHDQTKAVTDASESVTYQVTANNSTTLLVCLDSTISGVTAQGMTDGLGDDTESDCYTVDAAGNVNLSTVTVTVNGTTLTFM